MGLAVTIPSACSAETKWRLHSFTEELLSGADLATWPPALRRWVQTHLLIIIILQLIFQSNPLFLQKPSSLEHILLVFEFDLFN